MDSGELSEDFKQQKLCVNCFNGNHYFKWEMAHEVGRNQPIKVIVSSGRGLDTFSNCLQGGCECHCIALKQEKRLHVKPDKSHQLEMF